MSTFTNMSAVLDSKNTPVNSGVSSLVFGHNLVPLDCDEIIHEFKECFERALLHGQVEFTHSAIKEQFCHSCCHILAEHLLYVLHDCDAFSVSIIQIRKQTTIHSCIECIYKDSAFYVDASGVYRDIECVWSRYAKGSISEAYIEHHRGEAVIDDGDTHAVRKLSELTPFWTLICEQADSEGAFSGDMEHNSLNLITSELLRSK